MSYQKAEVRGAISRALSTARERAVRDTEDWEPLYRKVGDEFVPTGSETQAEEIARLTEQYVVDILADIVIDGVEAELWVSSSYHC